MGGMDIRPTTDQDLDLFISTMHTAFGMFPESPAADGSGVWWSALEMERNLFAYQGGRPVGTAGAYSFELTLPGATVVPAAGVTAVGVLPSHRRRGALTAMMRYQLNDLRARGEFLAVLLASEATIYGRYGYGPATYEQRIVVRRNQATLAQARGAASTAAEVEVRKRADCGDVLEAVYDRHRRVQPGALSRPPRWWATGAGHPPVSRAPRYVAVHRDGYASYTIDAGKMSVDEIVATDDDAFTALAKFVLGHDLVREIELRHLATDNPLRWQLADFRAGVVTEDTDWLWVRLLDVPRALTARGWLTDGEIVLDVDDPFLDEHNRYLLTVRDGEAECAPTDREPDLSMDIRDLGSIYLGGTAPSKLVRAGHIRARGSAAFADRLFAAERAPLCMHWF
ncbi:GNAT family N-acetyltransferase [Kibdelosporangium lantanae]